MTARSVSGRGLNSEINVTPMADIMLVLLIIFMIATPLLQNVVSVNLPKAKNPLTARSEASFMLALTRDGRLYLGKTPITQQELDLVLSERMAAEIDRTVFLKADEALAYGRVVDLVNRCRSKGVERIGLMAERQVESAAR